MEIFLKYSVDWEKVNQVTIVTSSQHSCELFAFIMRSCCCFKKLQGRLLPLGKPVVVSRCYLNKL